MTGNLPLLLFVALAAALFHLAYSAWLRDDRPAPQTAGRLDEEPAAVPAKALQSTFPTRYRYASPLAGLAAGALIKLAGRLPIEYSVAFGLLAAVLVYVFEEWLAAQRSARIEMQLADTIDLMVGALRAGTGLLASLEAAYQESQAPFRPYLRDLIGRIRLGEDPVTAIQSLAQRIPLETFRFFATSFCVHWETGGSMAQTLTTIGRTIRDRIEMSRRIQAQAVEVHASVVGIMGISYAVTFIMWRSNPGSLEEFLTSPIGAFIAASAIVLQAAGVFWISRMSRVRY
ncbi:MAG: type II secretion system F family protein [Bryobacterales bacterium]|nr:type II secretion system F family protein [Bryobacterales bacterium]